MPKRLKKAQDESVTAPHGDPFKDQLSAYMAKLGAKGGKVSGARRMDMPKKDRVAIAKKAAAARWGKKRPAQS
jgi:hypothetical protein